MPEKKDGAEYHSRVTLCRHPFVEKAINQLRDKHTPIDGFQQACRTVTQALCWEASRSWPTSQITGESPLESFKAEVPSIQPLLLPILRAGLGMLATTQDFFGAPSTGFLGLKRNEETLLPECYYQNIPECPPQTPVLILEPMLATGGSLDACLSLLGKNYADIRILSIIAAEPGVRRILQNFPEVTLFIGALDPALNDHGFIVPGLGDFGDRLHGS